MVVNKKLSDLLEQSEVDMLHSRLSAIRKRYQNPMGVEIQTFGNTTAFYAEKIPGPSFNVVKGLRDGDERYVGGILDYYKERNVPVRLELVPGLVSSETMESLRGYGFYHTDFHNTLYKKITEHDNTGKTSIAVRKLEQKEFSIFADIYTKGFQMPEFLITSIAENNAVLYGNKNWTFYLALVEEEPAGIAVLFIKNGIATLAAAATLPAYRRKGIQQALIKERLYEAMNQNTALAAGQAAVGSISQNNMEMAGFKVAYTKAIWTKNM
jgi:GNAT superfamily N-acetyltransferase